MMKKFGLIAALLVVVAFATPATAQPEMLTAGTQELGVGGFFEFSDEFDLLLNYGYFINEMFEVKAGLGIGWSDMGALGDETAFSITGGIDYHILQIATDTVVPYLTINAGYITIDSDVANVAGAAGQAAGITFREGKDNGFLLNIGGGVKYFLTSNVSLNLAILYEWASEDVFTDKDEPKDYRIIVPLVLNFYF